MTSKKGDLPDIYFDVTIDDIPAGRIVFQLFDDVVPMTCHNFRELAKGSRGYGYHKSMFFKIAAGQFIKGGDITCNNGIGGRSIFSQTPNHAGEFNDENFKIKNTKPYMLSMATTGPNTNTSQFFISTTPATWCNGLYVVFGEVLDGFDVIHKIDACPTKHGGAPLSKIIITQCGEESD